MRKPSSKSPRFLNVLFALSLFSFLFLVPNAPSLSDHRAPIPPSSVALRRSSPPPHLTGHDLSSLHPTANEAPHLGEVRFKHLMSFAPSPIPAYSYDHPSCPSLMNLSEDELEKASGHVAIPCGLAVGSHITIVAKPRTAHVEIDSEDQEVMVSQFYIELVGPDTDDGEPRTILHFNPRLKGDWSGKPVTEQNTAKGAQWGYPVRCEEADGRRMNQLTGKLFVRQLGMGVTVRYKRRLLAALPFAAVAALVAYLLFLRNQALPPEWSMSDLLPLLKINCSCSR